MRTAKKTLCLALVLAMMLSLCVFANATVEKVEDYADFADIPEEYVQAATILTALEVFQGYEEDDSFHGDNLLTRAQGAKILAVLMGYKDSMANPNATPKFEDMVGHWAVPYVNYLADTGIIHGKSATVFDPDGPLTGTQFAKMLLTALGYDADLEGLVGAGWDAKTARLALSADSYLIPDEETFGKFAWNENINRFTAAQMAFTTLLLPLVTYSINTRVFDTSSNRTNQTISSTMTNGNLFMVEFAERFFPTLVRNTHAGDEFGTPVVNWKLNNNVICKSTPKPVLSDNDGITGKEIVDEISRYRHGDNTDVIDGGFDVIVDGVNLVDVLDDDDVEAQLRSLLATKKLAGLNGNSTGRDWYAGALAKLAWGINNEVTSNITGAGTVVEIYVDDAAYENTHAGYTGGAEEVSRIVKVTIIIKHTWLATAVSSFKDDAVKVSAILDPVDDHSGKRYTAKKGDISGVKADDDLLVRITNPYEFVHTDFKANEIVEVYPAEVKEAVFVSGFSANDGVRMTSITADGEDYDAAEMAYTNKVILYDYANIELRGFKYDVYKDMFGNAIGVEYSSNDTSYVFITGYHSNGSNLGGSTYEVNAIFTDGTMMKNLVVTAKGSADALLSDTALTQIGVDYENKDGSPVLNAWFKAGITKDDDGNVKSVELREYVGAYKSGDDQGDIRQAAIVKFSEDNKGFDISSEFPNNKYKINAAGDVYAVSDDSTVFILTDATDSVGGGAITASTPAVTGFDNVSVNAKDLANTTFTKGSKSGDPISHNNFAFVDEFEGVSGAAFDGYGFVRDQYSDTYFIYNNKTNRVLFAVVVPAGGGDSEFVYVISNQKRAITEDGKDYAVYDAIYNGQKTEIKVLDSVKSDIDITAKELYKATFDKTGHITALAETEETVEGASTADLKDAAYFVVEDATPYEVAYKDNVLVLKAKEGDVDENAYELSMSTTEEVNVFAADATNGTPAKKDYEEYGKDIAGAIADATAKVSSSKQNQVSAIYATLDANGRAKSVVILYKTATAGTSSTEKV